MDEKAAEEARKHVLQAVILAQRSWAEVMETVAAAEDDEDAQVRLCSQFGLDPVQAIAILDTQVRRFTRAQRTRLVDEYERR